MSNPYKKSTSVETQYITETWKCCREWPIITQSLTYDYSTDMWKREYWPIGNCGLCDVVPRPMETVQ